MSSNLKNEVSLYLNEYRDSLVNWYPWIEEAFDKAKAEKKPIFLSIGYSSSHLCQLMKEESFNDEAIANMLNKNFISIKVDKDERPDIDKYFKQVYKLMNTQFCSSPISIFMTEYLEPFYSASYIAPYPKGNILGFYELLNVIKDKYNNDKLTMIEKGKEIISFVNPKNKKIEATKLDINILNIVTNNFSEVFDNINGGFGDIPKFLNASTIDLLLESYQMTQKAELLSMVTDTLTKMANGEIFDNINGGFYKYANNKDWSLPRKEKLIYDNANIAMIYLKTYQITDNNFYKNIAFKTIDFMLKEMSDGNLFYANSLIKKDGSIFIDTKIITSWNAMVVDTLFIASTIDNRYIQQAIKSIDKLLEQVYINGELYHTDNIQGFLEDYAYLGVALLSAYRATDNKEYLILSQTILNRAIDKFYQYGRWKFTDKEIEVYDDIYDLTYPSAIATILYLIEQISPLIEGDYSEILFKTLEINSYNLMRQPLSYPKMTKVLLLYLKNDIMPKK
ncbi:MAG TPA: thioredoxin domain-containing protein [Campylobacterales bacterium]|nr:thioredoxin domain-containing protein [Campylobacterales bacterium]HHC11224.1 thioredoxin domain-containing protein [Campylobacterales bacterium]HHD81399.1 thioredoxin domain-containing protein [Campylobacterales bacterium]